MTTKQPKDQRINTIIEAAVSEFLQKGYENASIESIARSAGLTKGGLYHHFSSKDELLIFANKKLSEPIEKIIENALLEQSSQAAIRHYIKNCLTFWYEHQKEVEFFFLTMTKLLDMPEVRDAYAQYYRDLKQVFVGLYENGIKNSEFKAVDPETYAVTLMSGLDGVLGMLIVDKEVDLNSIIEMFENQFVDSLVV